MKRDKLERPCVYAVSAAAVRGRDGYWFKWKADDFWATLSALKAAMPIGSWEFHVETREWWVVEGVDLTPIFANWKGVIEVLKLQGKLL